MPRSNGRIRQVILWAGLLAPLSAGACYPGEIQSVDELDLVLTAYDPLASFDSFATYAMPDTIIRIDDVGSVLVPAPGLDQQVLDAVATEFTALGYTRVATDAPGAPDVVLLLTVNAAESRLWSRDLWWSHWGWVPGWATWYPSWRSGWAPLYPWAGRYAGVRSPGTLEVVMIDADQPVAHADAIPVVWAAVIEGLFFGSEASVLSRFQGLIRQAFDQSPYL